MEEPIDNTVICQFRPRADSAEEFREVIREHRRALTELGLVTDRPEEVYVGQDQDGSGPLILAVFQWVDAEASNRAPAHPTVGAIWEKMATMCEDRPMGPAMAFPHFTVKETS